jgi:3-dehydroquinate synthase
MKTIDVPLKENGYKIVVGKDILRQCGRRLKGLGVGTDAVIVTNPIVYRRHAGALIPGLKQEGFSVKVFKVPDGERSKSADVAFSLMERIARYDRSKNIFIVAFGGGVIGDLAGYIAAAYKRGVPYVHVPTTFLAQIDSSIGGKVAIDLSVGKNLAGAFYQPKIVLSDVAVLATLDKRQLQNGLAEAVKYGVIADKPLFSFIARHYQKLLSRDLPALERVVVACSRIKAGVVSRDEKETKGVRTLLNFGHTAGHAIEAAGKYSHYQHGEAVALGMRIAANISVRVGMLAREDEDALNGVLCAIGLPRRIKKLKTGGILRAMRHDKKFISGRSRFVLAEKIGRVKVVEDIPDSIIRQSIEGYR